MNKFSGAVVSAPASHSGKTTVTLGVLRALKTRGTRVAGFKVGPDYIDPAYHEAASGRPCFNLDTWAMPPPTVLSTIARGGEGADLCLAEGAMGLFDGAIGIRDHRTDGSTASLAAVTGWPVLLVVPVRGVGSSVAALVDGFARHRPDVRVAGVILNRVGSARHETLLREAIRETTPHIRVLGALPERADLRLPERHLGLVQAREHPALDRYLEDAADFIADHLDLEALLEVTSSLTQSNGSPKSPAPVSGLLPVFGQHIAVARDDAFAFAYPALLESWRGKGTEITFFSPLADEAPGPRCDAIYLPGGYPELQAGRLSQATTFLSALRKAADRGLPVYGECGGYMVLGKSLTDGNGTEHPMADLLPMKTCFQNRQRRLGYRQAVLTGSCWLGSEGRVFRGHEFHYATERESASDEALFHLAAADGTPLGFAGHRRGTVCGSFIHLLSAL